MEGWKMLFLILFTKVPAILSQNTSETAVVSNIPAATTTAESVIPVNEPISELPYNQLEPFSQLRHGLRSGPIIIIDSKTLYIPNLHYDGKGPDAHFWAGNGTEPNAYGILVPDEKGLNKSIGAYNGQNVTIRLPGNLTIHSIDYFGMWCIEFKQNFGHVIIPKGLIIPERATNRAVIRLQRCCSERRTLQDKKCLVKNQTDAFVRRDHKAFESLEMFSFEYFVNYINCSDDSKLVQLKENDYIFNADGSFVYSKTKKILSQDYYCIDTDFKAGSEDSGLVCLDALNKNSSKLFFINAYFLIAAILCNIVH